MYAQGWPASAGLCAVGQLCRDVEVPPPRQGASAKGAVGVRVSSSFPGRKASPSQARLHLLSSSCRHRQERLCGAAHLRGPGLHPQPLQREEQRAGLLPAGAGRLLRGQRQRPRQRGAQPGRPGCTAGGQGPVGREPAGKCWGGAEGKTPGSLARAGCQEVSVCFRFLPGSLELVHRPSQRCREAGASVRVCRAVADF